MMINCTDFLKNDLFYCEHLLLTEQSKKEILDTFSVKRHNAKGLEEYIHKNSFVEEQENLGRTFLVRDCDTNEIACFFTLKAGLVSANESIREHDREFDSIPGIELADFAVNDFYKDKHPEVEHVGAIVFSCFIYKLALQISKCIGARFLYIFALQNESLIKYYESLNFVRPTQDEQYITGHFFTPRHNRNCEFMCQRLMS